MPNEAYELADKAIDLLQEKSVIRFEKSKRRINTTSFDELNVLKTVDDLYKNLDADTKEIFLDLARSKYESTTPHGDNPPDLSWLLLLLKQSDAVTKYIYENEVERKRARLFESLLSGLSKSESFSVALSYWIVMVSQYADAVSDEATIKSFKDAGVKKVRWISEMDGKECEICRNRHNQIYKITAIPGKPHWKCRCSLEAVFE